MGSHRKFPEPDGPKEEALAGPTVLPRPHGRLSWAAQPSSSSSTESKLFLLLGHSFALIKLPSTPVPGQMRTRTEAEKGTDLWGV